MNHPIYLDYNATTPVASEVAEAILSCVTEAYGNPSSSYPLGRQACAIVDGARRSVAELIGADADELYFTGCATEANNLALLGVARALGSAKRHLVVSAIEHPAIMEPAQQLKREGWSLTVVPVDHYGRVSVADVEASMRPDTALASIMHANNEIGTIQPIREISEIMRRKGVLLHTDAAQSVGKIPVDVQTLGVDLLTLAGHKFHATKGIGALYVRRGTPITNILFGAGQERGLRPGTENVPAIAGLGAASRLARERLPSVEARLGAMRDALHERLHASIPGLQLNGDSNDRLPNTLNLSFPAVSGRALVQAVSDHVAASVGSACHSEADAVSGVLAAIGCDGARAASAVRLSTGWPTTVDEIERAADALVTAWRQLARP